MRIVGYAWLLAGCTPPALDLPLAFDQDRHWGEGDVYRIADDLCAGAVTQGDGTALVVVDNGYFETTIVAAVLAPDCAELDVVEVAPGDEALLQVEVPAVIRIETVDGEVLSNWAVFYPLGEGAVHVQP